MQKFFKLFGYGIGDFGLNIYWKTLSLYLLFWYTTVVGLDPKVAGTLILIAMAWDAISDPIMATLSERVNTRFGTYRPFLLFGPAFLALSFFFLFWKPPFEGNLLIATLILISLAFRTTYTIVAIPYAALTSRITYDSVERSDLSGARMFCAFLGLLAVSMFLPPLVEHFTFTTRSGSKAFQLAAATGGGVATIALITCFFMTKEHPLPENTVKSTNTWNGIFRNIVSNRALQILLFVIILYTAATSCLTMTLVFYIEANQDTLAVKEIVLTTFAIGTLIFVPVWTYLVHHFGRKKIWLIAAILYTLTAAHMYFFSTTVINGIPVQIVMFGMIVGAFAIIFWAFIPDCVEYGQIQSGYRSEAGVFGSVLVVQKLSGGFMGFFIGYVLSSFGITADTTSTLSESGEKLTVFLALCPAVLLGLSVLPILTLPLGRDEHMNILKKLNSGDMIDG